jgi:hypothetical protein
MSCFADPQSEEGPHPDGSSLIGRLLVRFFVAGKEIQVNPLEHHRIPAENVGHVITFILCYLCKCLIINHLEARGVEPLSLRPLFRVSTCVADRNREQV